MQPYICKKLPEQQCRIFRMAVAILANLVHGSEVHIFAQPHSLLQFCCWSAPVPYVIVCNTIMTEITAASPCRPARAHQGPAADTQGGGSMVLNLTHSPDPV
jgi:hypothetical protein